ncbi:putative heparinase superfamily protein [Chelatococcus asaccharovorans]|uniref:Putative heparinase superfamily protein n=1 Tax=Chelatococcus asaccharovorans TaxID=28210 RepID=A0A2V3U7W4_9HYPH|nr:putative heparinase superfamily protein [Chelatococcus asaccharovorans]CAH1657815.1 putative heparinase superfamily protein [Chelatococcus asaccharovorans]
MDAVAVRRAGVQRTKAVVAQGTDRWRLYGLALGEAWRRLRYCAASTWRSVFSLHRFVPDRILIVPQDLRTADPTVAGDIYSGYYALAGRVVNTRGSSPFNETPPSRAWAEALYGFGWLRHLRAADSALSRANARALVDDFFNHASSRRGIAIRPRVAARRLISLLDHSPLVLDGADRNFYRRFTRTLGRTAGQLQLSVAGGLRGNDRLIAAIALAYVGLCLNAPGRVLRQANRLLTDELNRQVLPDGGHISRNPRLVVELLTDLLPLSQTYAARGAEPPPGLIGAIDRMMPVLRMFRHGEGSLGLFNGMGLTQPDLVATLLAYDDVRAKAMEHAPHSGYERLEAGETIVLMDVGGPPPAEFSHEAHAGCLSFEMSVNAFRLVVNCGAPRPGTGQSTVAARSTAAHSTVTIGDVSSCHFAGTTSAGTIGRWLGRFIGTPVLSGPRHVAATRETMPDGLSLKASHDGYLARFGLIHERRLDLGSHGDRLEGEDSFISEERPTPPGTEATLRFHLHPSVRASRIADGPGIFLVLPNQDCWSFEVDAGELSLEESVFFAASDGIRRTAQIVVTIDVSSTRSVRWRFLHLGHRSTAGDS